MLHVSARESTDSLRQGFGLIKSEPMALASGVEANGSPNPDPLSDKGLMQPHAQPLRDPRLGFGLIRSEPLALASGVEANGSPNPDPLSDKGLMQPHAQPLRDPRLAPAAHFSPCYSRPISFTSATKLCAIATTFSIVCFLSLPAFAQTVPDFGQVFDKVTQGVSEVGQNSNAGTAESFLLGGPEKWTSPQGLSSSLQILLLLTVLSLAPAILLMTTCYVRIIVVLGLLRQALGTGQLPPSQVITSIAIFMTMFVMAPVWNRVYEDSIRPYTDPNTRMSTEQAWNAGIAPVRDFMSRQIDMAGNHDDVVLFYSYYLPDSQPPEFFKDVPLRVLLPAYMLSELKTAFLIGFQIYLPFLLIDLVVAAVTISMGMMMLPPAMISLPFKLLLFVLIDGWHLVVGMLLESFGTIA